MDDIRLEVVSYYMDCGWENEWHGPLPPKWIGDAQDTLQLNTLVFGLIRYVLLAGGDDSDRMPTLDHGTGDFLDDQRHTT
jgi:hypothetical protein